VVVVAAADQALLQILQAVLVVLLLGASLMYLVVLAARGLQVLLAAAVLAVRTLVLLRELVALVEAGGLQEVLVHWGMQVPLDLVHTVVVQQAARSPEIQTSHGWPLAPVLGVSHEH
jgi:hypothetical protein